ncbi:hypothetical protein MUJ63_11690 [Lachnospiraceae bacterium NSJ-143]|nr:hypothetical protein [Lachnospiraceae bacterium NSJ-143]
MKKIWTLILMICLLFSVSGCSQKKNSNVADSNIPKEESGESGTVEGEPEKTDIIPMVMVNGSLYYDTGRESEIDGRCGNMDGEITSTVDSSEIPSVDDQSNFGTGYGYQYEGKGTIEIFMNEKWFVFEQKWLEYTFTDSNVDDMDIKFSISYPEGWKLTKQSGWEGDETKEASPSVGVTFFDDEDEIFSVFVMLFSPYDFEEGMEPFETRTGLKGYKDVISNDGRVYAYYVFEGDALLPQYVGIVNMSEENYEKKKNDIEAVLDTLEISKV